MKNIIIIILTLILFSCATSKKVTNTDYHSNIDTQNSYSDSSKTTASWEVILNSVIKEIDLTKIRITTYYPQKDSAGKQLIKEVISIDNDKTVIASTAKKELRNEHENKAINSKTTFHKAEVLKTITKDKKARSPVRLYLFLTIIVTVLCIFLFIKHKANIIYFIKRIFK